MSRVEFWSLSPTSFGTNLLVVIFRHFTLRSQRYALPRHTQPHLWSRPPLGQPPGPRSRLEERLPAATNLQHPSPDCRAFFALVNAPPPLPIHPRPARPPLTCTTEWCVLRPGALWPARARPCPRATSLFPPPFLPHCAALHGAPPRLGPTDRERPLCQRRWLHRREPCRGASALSAKGEGPFPPARLCVLLRARARALTTTFRPECGGTGARPGLASAPTVGCTCR